MQNDNITGEPLTAMPDAAPPAPAAAPNPQDGTAAEAKIDEAVTEALLGGKPDLAGLTIYGYTLASAALLRDARSSLQRGILPSEFENLELEIAKFLVIQTTDLMDDEAMVELAEIVKDPEKFRLRALDFARQIEGTAANLIGFCLSMIADADKTAVRVIQRESSRPGATLESIHQQLFPKA